MELKEKRLRGGAENKAGVDCQPSFARSGNWQKMTRVWREGGGGEDC